MMKVPPYERVTASGGRARLGVGRGEPGPAARFVAPLAVAIRTRGSTAPASCKLTAGSPAPHRRSRCQSPSDAARRSALKPSFGHNVVESAPISAKYINRANNSRDKPINRPKPKPLGTARVALAAEFVKTSKGYRVQMMSKSPCHRCRRRDFGLLLQYMRSWYGRSWGSVYLRIGVEGWG